MKDLLLSLPSYTAVSRRGHDLLQVLLDKAKICFPDDTRSGTPSLKTTRFFLDLASFLAVRKQVAPPADLLRFYCQYLGKMNLSSLPRDDHLYFIQHTAETLAASEAEYLKHSDKLSATQLSTFREQIVTASPTIIQASIISLFRELSFDPFRISYLRNPNYLLQSHGNRAKRFSERVYKYVTGGDGMNHTN